MTGYMMNESWMTEREQSAGGGLEERRVQIDAREDREPGLLVAGLDIGSTKICAMIGEVFPDRVDIIGVGTSQSSGMRKGVVVNIQSTVEAVKKAVKKASDMAGCDINQVYVGIAAPTRSEERRVGKKCRYRWSPYH